jgi:hypothetical protein
VQTNRGAAQQCSNTKRPAQPTPPVYAPPRRG